MKKVRIAFYGNICNNLYQIAKALRQSADADAHLFIDSAADPQQLPESDDPELADNYPAWIHKRRFLNVFSLLLPWLSHLARELRTFDFIVVSGNGPIFAQFSGRPFAFLTAGADLTVLPFPLQSLRSYPTVKLKLFGLLAGFWQRRAIRRSTEIWTQPFYPFLNPLKRLGVPAGRISPAYFPVIIDADRVRYNPAARQSNLQAMKDIVSRDPDFVLFHPARMFIRMSPKIVETGRFKGNDILIRGFAEFVSRKVVKRPLLVLIDRDVSGDVDLARQLIRSLGIEEYVYWAKGPRRFGFTRDELTDLYSVSDVVADDFSVGWFGSIVLEGLAVERPVISFVDERAMSQMYAWHPILSSKTERGIADFLSRLATDVSFRTQQGRLGRRWILEYHSHGAAAGRYVTNVNDGIQRTVGVRVPFERAQKDAT